MCHLLEVWLTVLVLFAEHKYSAGEENGGKIAAMFDGSLVHFRCDDVPQCPVEYRGHGLSYVCNERKEVPTCHSPPAAVPEAMPRGACRRACHFNLKCESFAWSPLDTVCRQCLVGQGLERKRHGYDYRRGNSGALTPDETSSSRKMVYGTVLGALTSLAVDESDYIEQGYISNKGKGHILEHTFIPKNTRSVKFVYTGNFCAFDPVTRGTQEEDLPGTTWMTLSRINRSYPSTQSSLLTIAGILLFVVVWRRKIMKVQRQLQTTVKIQKAAAPIPRGKNYRD